MIFPLRDGPENPGFDEEIS